MRPSDATASGPMPGRSRSPDAPIGVRRGDLLGRRFLLRHGLGGDLDSAPCCCARPPVAAEGEALGCLARDQPPDLLPGFLARQVLARQAG